MSPYQVRQLIDYDPETGMLHWRKRDSAMFSSDGSCNAWNARFAGKSIRNIGGKGYSQVVANGRCYQAHRVAWAHFHGAWPEGDIDHINGDKSDNRLSNLRDVPHAENGRNRATSAHNTSGVNGVNRGGRHGKWQARITKDGKTRSLGYFDDLASAAAARKEAEARLGFHPNHGRKNG